MKNKLTIIGRSGGYYQKNSLFSPHYNYFKFTNKKIQREDKNIGLVKLKKELKKKNIITKTSDIAVLKDRVAIEMHFFGNFPKGNFPLTYCVLPEIPAVARNCKIKILKRKYDKIFTNIEDDIDNKKIFHINLPVSCGKLKLLSSKKKFACIFANNKNLASFSLKNGYSERSKLISWFLKNHPNKLDIYGGNWDVYYSSNYFINRALSFFQNKINYKKKKLEQFKGLISNKTKIMSQYKFNICFENSFDINGYFTEKIFDSFNACTIPVYLGCGNVEKYIPSNAFINFKSFKSLDELYFFMSNISDSELKIYQKNIIDFMYSKKFEKFHYNNFIKILTSHIARDIKKIIF
jgi:hypothetical protein